MPDSPHRFIAHLGRQKMTYAVVALALYISPVPAMAAELVGTADLENGAVTTPKLATDSVTSTKIVDDTITRSDIRDGAITGTEIPDLEWHNFNLLNEWVSANGAGLRTPAWAIDAEGTLHLRGAIKDGDTTSFARIPAAHRPSTTVYVTTSLAGAEPGQIVIDPTGYLQADYADTFQDAIDFTTLDGVSWTK